MSAILWFLFGASSTLAIVAFIGWWSVRKGARGLQ